MDWSWRLGLPCLANNTSPFKSICRQVAPRVADWSCDCILLATWKLFNIPPKKSHSSKNFFKRLQTIYPSDCPTPLHWSSRPFRVSFWSWAIFFFGTRSPCALMKKNFKTCFPPATLRLSSVLALLVWMRRQPTIPIFWHHRCVVIASQTGRCWCENDFCCSRHGMQPGYSGKICLALQRHRHVAPHQVPSSDRDLA